MATSLQQQHEPSRTRVVWVSGALMDLLPEVPSSKSMDEVARNLENKDPRKKHDYGS
jgi:hypothetical protein